MAYDTIATLSQLTSLLMFMAMFLAVLVYALRPKNGPQFDRAQQRALDLDDRSDADRGHA